MRVKIGDLVRLKDSGRVGVITDMSEASPVFPYQVLSITFSDGSVDGILPRAVELVSES